MSGRKPATIDENNLYGNAGLRKILLEGKEEENECVETLNKRFEISSIKLDNEVSLIFSLNYYIIIIFCVCIIFTFE